MLGGVVRISLRTYKEMLARYNLGEPHPTLVGDEQWHPAEERRRQDEITTEELIRAGLVRGGRLTPEFHDTVQLLQHPQVEYYTFCRVDGQPVTARAACGRGEAVIMVARSGVLSLSPSRLDRATLDLAAQLPDTPPLPGVHSMSCSQADYLALQRGETPRTSPSVADAKRMLSLMRLPRRHVGQFYAAIRDGQGRRVRTTMPPLWIDTDEGRFLTISDTNGWVSVSAAGTHDIARLWSRLESQLRTR